MGILIKKQKTINGCDNTGEKESSYIDGWNVN
jgi:hypothetical protein